MSQAAPHLLAMRALAELKVCEVSIIPIVLPTSRPRQLVYVCLMNVVVGWTDRLARQGLFVLRSTRELFVLVVFFVLCGCMW